MDVISPQAILDVLGRIEQGAPVDFGDSGVDPERVRHLVAHQLFDLHRKLVALQPGAAEARELLMLATASRAILENMSMQARGVAADGRAASGELRSLMKKLGVGGY